MWVPSTSLSCCSGFLQTCQGEHLSLSIFLKYLEERCSVAGEYLEDFYLQRFSIENRLLTKELQCYIAPWCSLFTQAYKQKVQEGAIVTLSQKTRPKSTETPNDCKFLQR